MHNVAINNVQFICSPCLQVKLLSKSSGLLKFKTDCAPNSGYYLIPLYDKGEYVLTVEGPEGWSFGNCTSYVKCDHKVHILMCNHDHSVGIL